MQSEGDGPAVAWLVMNQPCASRVVWCSAKRSQTALGAAVSRCDVAKGRRRKEEEEEERLGGRAWVCVRADASAPSAAAGCDFGFGPSLFHLVSFCDSTQLEERRREAERRSSNSSKRSDGGGKRGKERERGEKENGSGVD